MIYEPGTDDSWEVRKMCLQHENMREMKRV